MVRLQISQVKINWNSIQIRTQSHGVQTVNIEDDKFTVNSSTGNGKTI